MQLCIACSATLDSDSSAPTSSEKPQSPVVFSCRHAVCGRCITKRRRLAQACIMCQSAHDVLGSGTSSRASSKAPTPSASSSRLPAYSAPAQDQAGDFVLGDDSDVEDDAPPPPLDALFDGEQPPAYEDEGAPPVLDDKREQCSLHYLKPDETLLGLSMRYGVPGHLLCSMNKLPLSTLSTTPHLVHTLPFLLLPPSASPSTSTAPLLPAPLERRRLVVRRFQMQTRCADWAVAAAYVDQVFKRREVEAEFVRQNRAARAGERGEGEGEREGEGVVVREGGELDEAVEAWRRDERWEREQQAQGKGKGVIGSKLGSTGQAKIKVRTGWGW
ncbi:hypothetical protein JCM5296_001830 [Sporobolomyces johnsonii]